MGGFTKMAPERGFNDCLQKRELIPSSGRMPTFAEIHLLRYLKEGVAKIDFGAFSILVVNVRKVENG